MLGWEINVFRELGGPRLFLDRDRLASWRTGVAGTDWLNQLVQEKRAMVLYHGSGYPFRYAVQLEDLIAHLSSVISPHDGSLESSRWRFELDQDALKACAAHEVVIIDAWDQS